MKKLFKRWVNINKKLKCHPLISLILMEKKKNKIINYKDRNKKDQLNQLLKLSRQKIVQRNNNNNKYIHSEKGKIQIQINNFLRLLINFMNKKKIQ